MVLKELKHISKIDNANTIGDMRNLQVQRAVSNRSLRKCLNRTQGRRGEDTRVWGNEKLVEWP